MKIFAFGHRRYVGKDTAARFLINHIRLNHGGQQVEKITFATKMKENCYELFKHLGLKPTEYYEQHPEEKDVMIPALGMTARNVWISYGNYVRAIYNDTWIDYAFNHVSAQILLATDIRFPNEAEAIKSRGGILIRIDRHDAVKFFDVADTALEDYQDWNYIIDNSGTLNDLYRHIITIVDKELW